MVNGTLLALLAGQVLLLLLKGLPTMALLHYQNLGIHRPDVLMKNVFYGLRTFYEFLSRTKDYMESDAAVKRLSWKPGFAPAGEGGSPQAVGKWILLEEPPDRRNEPESTFRAFLDENVREVFEASLDDVEAEGGQQSRNGRCKFTDDRKIEVLDRDPETSQLLLANLPKSDQILLRPNTLTVFRQIKALQALQDAPTSFHLPLLWLMESTDHVQWPSFFPVEIGDEEWMVLTDPQRPGTDEQRRFVKVALATPDFAFLEGPPGSGKTTAICELVLQLAQKGKRVLLCASTHVAVDNVLERLMDERNSYRDLIIPIRIGERRNVSDKARPFQLEQFVKTERERLLGHLGKLKTPTESQKAFATALRYGSTAIERMVLDAANLVCGTTIGILQHPDIKANGATKAAFDVLIVDEASKTTFQEFLVPALLAKRWVIVGDPKQLSPYVDDDGLAVNVQACLQDEAVRNACVDVFLAGQTNPKKRRVTVVATDSSKTRATYIIQASARDVCIAEAGKEGNEASVAALVVGEVETVDRLIDTLPLDAATVRAPEGRLDSLRRRADAWLRISKRGGEEQPEWAAEVGWRLARRYEQRFAENIGLQEGRRRSTSERLREQIEGLLPVPETGVPGDVVWNEIDRVRRIALPSILESLRHGFERNLTARKGSALSEGLPPQAMSQRHALLSTQHRMHPDIARFSHQHIYDSKALITPEYMVQEREWGFRSSHRAVWLDVRGGFKGHFNSNPYEARAVVDELRSFDEWSQRNPRRDGRPWEAAVLTFYRGQEREVRSHLRRWTKQETAIRRFARGGKQRPYLTIELCTVDRFQGHEADLVIITFANDHPTSFLESPNRLNVALTRARYQRVVIGDRKAMARAEGSVLGMFINSEPWEQSIRRITE